jgi:hypothetical protein
VEKIGSNVGTEIDEGGGGDGRTRLFEEEEGIEEETEEETWRVAVVVG